MSETRILPWRIERTSPADEYCESLFFTGNGCLGLRAFPSWEAKQNPQDHAVFKAGLFSHINPRITDMVQLPDLTGLIPLGHAASEVKQVLDMRTGIVSRSWESDGFLFEEKHTASMADPQLILCSLTVTVPAGGSLTVRALQDPLVRNLPVHDDQMIRATDLVQLLEIDSVSHGAIFLHTVAENIPVSLSWQILCGDAARENGMSGGAPYTDIRLQSASGEKLTVEKRIRILSGNETPSPDSDDPWEESAKAWEKLWRDCDVIVASDDPEMQGAVRYNIFQMLASDAASQRTVSIGARGLTHGRYKGNTFWDTEIFLFPFYLWHRPEAARNLLLYRADRLEDAKALARAQNLEGARFPWMCSSDGKEQCESWDIGLCEVHITADIAYALSRYCDVTGDSAFRNTVAREIWRETGRYWLSRLTWEEDKQCFSSFFVKGPDEYCGAAVNNTYTNYMARNNLRLAAEAETDAEQAARLGFAADHIRLLYDAERQLYLQDENFFRLEPLPKTEKTDDQPCYKRICFDRLQRYRVIKQADLVLLMTLYPDAFTREEKENVFDTYEPLTLHDSTLSWGIHALLAMRLGKRDMAEKYLKKALYLDLKNLMGNTGREGIHMAALGAAWQALIYGAAGLWDTEDGPRIDPKLPDGITGLTFRVYCRGERYRADISSAGSSLTKEAD